MNSTAGEGSNQRDIEGGPTSDGEDRTEYGDVVIGMSEMVRRGSASIARASEEFVRYATGEQAEEEITEQRRRSSFNSFTDVEAGNNNLSLRNLSEDQAGAERFSFFDMLPISNKNLSPRSPSVKSAQRGSGTYVPTFRCGICLENTAETERFSIESCGEPSHTFCSECMGGYVKSQVEAAVTLISCPGTSPGCSGIIDIDRVRSVVSSTGDEHLMEQVERFYAMNNNENFRECPSCNEPNITGTPENPEMKCSKCGETYCFIHANAHPNMTCTQYAQKKVKEDRANLEFIEETTKECPVCKAKTFKNGGCNHMTCVHCHSDWCWLCSQHMPGGGGAVTEHYTSGGCAGQQFRGFAEDVDDRLLIYICCCIEDPNRELNMGQRIVLIGINNLIVGVLNLCVCPCLILACGVGCVLGFCGAISAFIYECFRAVLIAYSGGDQGFSSCLDEWDN